MTFPVPQWNSLFQLKHDQSSSYSFKIPLLLMVKQDLPPYSCVDHGDAPSQQSTKLLEQAVSDSICPWGLGGCSWPPHLSGDGPWGPPGREVCGSSAGQCFRERSEPQPSTQGLRRSLKGARGGRHHLT